MLYPGGGAVSHERGISVNPKPYSSNRKPYRGTSLIRSNPPLGPYSMAMHRALWCF
jgi:hypothetical protein